MGANLKEKLQAIWWFLRLVFKRKDKDAEQWFEWFQKLPEKDRQLLSDELLKRAERTQTGH